LWIAMGNHEKRSSWNMMQTVANPNNLLHKKHQHHMSHVIYIKELSQKLVFSALLVFSVLVGSGYDVCWKPTWK
jgi:hypothetical protein